MKTILISLLLLLQVSAFCQVPKKVVAELFTNTRCSICGAKDPNIFRVIHYFPNDVLEIAYYPSAPYSTCFFSLQNAVENDARTNYYNTYGSTPDVFLQGVPVSNSLDTNTVKPFLNQTTDFEIRLSHSSVTGSDSGMVTCTIIRRGNDTLQSANIFLAVQEDSIDYAAPNGIPRHYGVFRKSVTASQGDAIALPQQIGDSVSISGSYAFKAAWNKNLLSAFAILQKKSDRSIVQGAKEKLVLTTVSGIADVVSNKISVFPNPVSDKLIVTNSNNYTSFEIYNVLGETIERSNLNQNTISTSQLNEGIYFIRFTNAASASDVLQFQKVNK